MGQKEIIAYVMHSPENTNPNMLKSMFRDMDEGGSINKEPTVVEADIIYDGADSDIVSYTTYSDLVQLNNNNKIIVLKITTNGESPYYTFLYPSGNDSFRSVYYGIIVDSTGWHR